MHRDDALPLPILVMTTALHHAMPISIRIPDAIAIAIAIAIATPIHNLLFPSHQQRRLLIRPPRAMCIRL